MSPSDASTPSGAIGTVPARRVPRGKAALRAGAQARQEANVGLVERAVSAVAGSALALCGLRRRSLAGLVAAGVGSAIVYRGLSGRCGVYRRLGITSQDATPLSHPLARHVRVRESATINKPAAEIYAFFLNFENLPRFMHEVVSVEAKPGPEAHNGAGFHWVALSDSGSEHHWNTETIEKRENELISWRSTVDAPLSHSGSVRLRPAPAGRGTEVRLELSYRPIGGALGATARALAMRDARAEFREDLRRLRQLLETGEIATTIGQPRGRCGR